MDPNAINSLRLILISIPLILAVAVVAQVQAPIFSEDKIPSFSSIYHVDSLSNTSKDADLILRVNKNAPFNCTKDTCPASVIINNKTGAVNMVTPVKVNSLYVGDQQVIDSTGKWTGSNSGLVGPKGDDGDKGATGDKGDSCAIQGSDIVCGTTRTPLAMLRGADGRAGDSCSIQGSDIVCGTTRTPLASLRGTDGRNGDNCAIVDTNLVCGQTQTPLASLKGADGRNGDNCAIQGSDIVCGSTKTPLASLKGADGRNGDNCSIQGSDIVCGSTRTPLASLKGADGRNGDNCSIQGSDIVCGSTRTPLASLKGADGRNGDSCSIIGTNLVCGQTQIPLSSLKGDAGRNGDNCAIVGTDIVCGSTRTPLASLKGADGKKGDSCSINDEGEITCGSDAPVNVVGPRGPSGSVSSCSRQFSTETAIFNDRYTAEVGCGSAILTGGGCIAENLTLDFFGPESEDPNMWRCTGMRANTTKTAGVRAIILCCK